MTLDKIAFFAIIFIKISAKLILVSRRYYLGIDFIYK